MSGMTQKQASCLNQRSFLRLDIWIDLGLSENSEMQTIGFQMALRKGGGHGIQIQPAFCRKVGAACIENKAIQIFLS